MRQAIGDKTTVFWNANSLRQRGKKGGFETMVKHFRPDRIFILEAKCEVSKLPLAIKQFLLLEGYPHVYEHVSTREPAKWGYAGVICFSKDEATSVNKGIDDPFLDEEGRALTLTFEDEIVSGIYFPNAGKPGELFQIEKKIEYMRKFRSFIKKTVPEGIPLMIGGDTNVARRNNDRYDAVDSDHNANNPACTKEERNELEKLITDLEVIDQMERFQNEPEYTWFMRPEDRYQNKGMRIDHVLANDMM